MYPFPFPDDFPIYTYPAVLGKKHLILRMPNRLRRFPLICTSVLFLSCIFLSGVAFGDDGAASMAAGGLELPRGTHISIRKERLEISEAMITADLDVRNDAGSDITTDMAFHFPSYGHGANEDGLSQVDKFHVSVDGREVTYVTDIDAVIDQKTGSGWNVTLELRKFGVDVVALYPDPDGEKELTILDKLSDAQQNQMRELGLLDKDFLPLWHVDKLCHWTQTFFAHKLVHIHQEYAPGEGFLHIEAGDLDPQRPPHPPEPQLERASDLQKQLQNACVEPSISNSLGAKSNPSAPLFMSWVDYLLTTDKSWQMPIRDFTLVLDQSARPGFGETVISACWDGFLRRLDAAHLEAHQLNLVPSKDLHIVFFSANPVRRPTEEKTSAVSSSRR